VKENLAGVFEHRDGVYRRVGDGEALRAGAAYLVVAAQDLPAPDPLRLSAGFGGVTFDAQSTLSEIELDLRASNEPRQLSLRAEPSLVGPSNTDWLEVQASDGGFVPLGAGENALVEVPAGATRLRLALRASRQGVAAASAAQQAALVEIRGPEGVTALEAELNAPTLQGVWIGEASISEVEKMSLYGPGYAPVASVSMSLILEIPPAGRPRLLPCLQVESNRDGRQISFRLEAALFHEATDLFGTIGAAGTSGAVSATLSMAADHPLNPYKHRYHPEHGLGYDLTRSLKLRFGAQGPEPAPDPFATVGVLSGVYEEEIVGLTQEPIHVRGGFRLRRLAGGSATPCAGARK
jgi:hypothetical protein